MTRKVNDLRAELLCLEIDLAEAEQESILVVELCELLSHKSKELEDNIKFLKKQGIITVAHEYKKNKERLGTIKDNLKKQEKEKRRLNELIVRTSEKKEALLSLLIDIYDRNNVTNIGEYIERKRKTIKD